MVICFPCSRELRDTLDRLVREGRYRDHADVIATAVQNLAVLEAQVDQGGVLEFHASAPSTHPTTQSGSVPRPNASETDPLTLDGLPGTRPAFLVATHVPDNSMQTVGLDTWVFGQFNKLLPAKVSCRVLANLGKGPVEAIAIDVAQHAARFATRLRHLDERDERGRDDLLSTAFPGSEEKSVRRYATQFVASVSKTGKPSGLLVALQLAALSPDDQDQLVLTEAGWDFAVLTNPLLDSNPSSSTRFSDQEVEFLLRHISTVVPAEAAAYLAIVRAISAGHDTPKALDHELRTGASKPRRDGLSESFLASQRSGALSRMGDLDLVARRRDGVRVRYHLTERGRRFAKEQNA